MTDSEKELIKLRAAAVDRASTACLTVGILAPIAAALYTGGTSPAEWKLFLGSVLYLGAAILLHHSARLTLKELDL